MENLGSRTVLEFTPQHRYAMCPAPLLCRDYRDGATGTASFLLVQDSPRYNDEAVWNISARVQRFALEPQAL